MWERRSLIILWALTACERDSFTLPLLLFRSSRLPSKTLNYNRPVHTPVSDFLLGYEPRSSTLRKEHTRKLQLFENKCERKMDNVSGQIKMMHNVIYVIFICRIVSIMKSRGLWRVRNVIRIRYTRNAYQILSWTFLENR
jgi:hypothetical protein